MESRAFMSETLAGLACQAGDNKGKKGLYPRHRIAQITSDPLVKRILVSGILCRQLTGQGTDAPSSSKACGLLKRPLRALVLAYNCRRGAARP